jgi:hypothetical protein
MVYIISAMREYAHELKLLLFFILLSLNCFAESSGIQKINSETELIDGNIYTLRGFNPVTNMCYTFDGWHADAAKCTRSDIKQSFG